MDKFRKEILNRCVGILIVLLGIFVFAFYKDNYSSLESALSHVKDEPIIFSAKSGFFEETLYLRLEKDLEIPHGAKIYYTLNGDDPDINDNEYVNGIELSLIENEIKVYPVKATVFFKDEYSEIQQETYIVGKEVKEEFDLDVINISTDNANLYDYYIGILADGYIYDTTEQNPNGDKKGNYTMEGEEWVRDANLTMFNKEGNLLINQEVGIEVSGGSSRSYDVKSFNITAGNNYLPNPEKLVFENFYDEYTYTELSAVNEYNNIKLRSGSQDRTDTNIKSSITSRLAEESNFDGYRSTNRCVVYLNGEYYGIFDVQQNYANSFLARRFNLDNSELVEKYKGSEKKVLADAELIDLFETDLNIETNRKRLEEKIDMDNFLLYYAIEILMNNTDWPQNNYRIWRYTGGYDGKNDYTDGRYRMLLYDTDLIYVTNEHRIEVFGKDVFQSIMESLHSAKNSVFPKVLNSTYYREKFLIIIQDLLNTSFAEENILLIVEEEFNKISEQTLRNNGVEIHERLATNVERMKEKIKQRDEMLLNLFKEYFELEAKYRLVLNNTEGVSISWNNMRIYENEFYENTYFYGTSFILNQEAYPGYKFDYWVVNGEKIYTEQLNITMEMIQDEICNVSVSASNLENVLVIEEVSAKNDSDWIKVYNAGKSNIDLSGYYLSDSKNNLYKYQLPNISLKSKESLVINGNKNYYAIGDYICNFNLNNMETLYLTNKEQNIIIDEMDIPRMDKYETYGRFDHSNKMVFYNNKQGQRKIK